MIRLATLFWLVLVSATGFVTFAVKYEVQALDDELARTKKASAAEDHEIRVLDAEWAYLTRPETLDEMNRRYLSLGPIATKQLRTTVDNIPLRAPPPAPVEVAAVTETPPPESVPPAAMPAVMPASLEKPAGVPELGKPVPPKTTAKPVMPRRPKTLDELFTQVAVGR